MRSAKGCARVLPVQPVTDHAVVQKILLPGMDVFLARGQGFTSDFPPTLTPLENSESRCSQFFPAGGPDTRARQAVTGTRAPPTIFQVRRDRR